MFSLRKCKGCARNEYGQNNEDTKESQLPKPTEGNFSNHGPIITQRSPEFLNTTKFSSTHTHNCPDAVVKCATVHLVPARKHGGEGEEVPF